ncbi:MAG: aspartyl/glutamyl-tRNA amidotransferase subunit B [Chitinophagaceae bacterium]|nr:aspartyl/glutamyl-tRNA amidotransferase subunit B [Chitinophagaceae bacterium]
MSAPYEMVVGLEVHIQLLTQSKLFCADATAFGAQPNSQVSAISLAHPGTLPMLNRQAVELAIRLGLALQCDIARHSHFDRKHYFYPDLPKGYQTSQLTEPILTGGWVDTLLGKIPIHHIHLEEDAGKSIHDADPDYSCIDLNRAGMPLLELVTEPAIHSSDAAFAFLTQGETRLGTKVEVKNLNSIRNVKRAIEAEAKRQIELLERGERIVQETRGYNADTNTTTGQREKEEANDYRYFPCPDLPPFTTNEAQIEAIRQAMPALPQQLQHQLTEDWQLPKQDAAVLTEDKAFADYFLDVVGAGAPAKPAANWMLGPVKNWLNEHQGTIEQFPLPPSQIAALITIVQSGKVNFSMAATRLLPDLLQQPSSDVLTRAQALGIIQESDSSELDAWVQEVMARMPDKVKEYQKGKKGLIGLFVGEVKKLSRGKADPQAVTKILEEKLKEA